MNLNGVEYYYIRNAQGDIIGLFDKNGTQVVSYTYDTWGKLVSIDRSFKDSVGVKNPYRYRGYHYDTEIGPYSDLEDLPSVSAGKDFTPAQKKKSLMQIRQETEEKLNKMTLQTRILI